MKKILLMLLALLGLPMVWVLTRCFLEALAIDALESTLLSPGRIAFSVGCLLMTLLYAWKGQSLQIIYVFAHEMTHAIVGLCCFAKVHRVSVKTTAGFVQLSKSNLFITLAPYCVPFYLLLLVITYGIVQYFAANVIPFIFWAGLFGMASAFHVWYTAGALCSVSQPDTHEYGRFFSGWFILVMNLLFAIIAVVITSPTITARDQAKRLTVTSATVYRTVYIGISERIKPLVTDNATQSKGVQK